MGYPNMDDNTYADKIAAIERYLARGWAPVQLHYIRPDGHCSCGRGIPGSVGYVADHDFRQGGKHPVVSEWQREQPGVDHWHGALAVAPFNIGIATGRPSNHWVLDYDPASAAPMVNGQRTAVDLVHALIQDAGMPPHVTTGGGGWHWRFAMPADFEPTNRRGTLPTGLDVRGTGGQVVAPPSVSGKGVYVELTDAGPYVAPAWLLDMIRPAAPLPRMPPAGWSPSPSRPVRGDGAPEDDRSQRYAAAAMVELLAELAGAPEGTRNDTAFRVGARLVELSNAGWIAEHTAAGSFAEAVEACGLPWAEGHHVWQSAVRHVGDRPAELPPEWTDPLRPGEVWPDAVRVGVAPFSGTSPNGTSPYPSQLPSQTPSQQVSAVTATFVEPPALGSSTSTPGPSTPTACPPLPTTSGLSPGSSPNGRHGPPSAGSTPTEPAADPVVAAWNAAVEREAHKVLLREAARRRARELEQPVGGADALEAELLDIDGILAIPPNEPLIEGVLYLDSLARLNGPSGHGKSFIAIDIALRVTRGLPWAGRAVRAGRVCYILAEGVRGIGRRITAWEERYGKADRSAVHMLPRPVQMLGPEWAALVEVCRRGRYDLVIIDTQARATEGIDEIDRAEMSRLVAAGELLRRSTGACVLLVHHTPQQGDDGRGHTEVKGALQSELLARKTGRTIKITSRKQKDDDDFAPIEFDLVDVPAPTPDVPAGFVEPPGGGVAVLGVVPVWRGDAAVMAEVPGEPAYRSRARALWTAMRAAYPAEPALRSEIKQLFADKVMPDVRVNSSSFRMAWTRSWQELVRLGLIGKAYRESRFCAILVPDQSKDGVLTSNRNDDGSPLFEPAGYEVRGVGDSVYGE